MMKHFNTYGRIITGIAVVLVFFGSVVILTRRVSVANRERFAAKLEADVKVGDVVVVDKTAIYMQMLQYKN
jgi:hypothetical protein